MILGVDPGASGAIAALELDGSLAWVHDMPHHDGIVAPALVADLFHGTGSFDAAWVEDVHSMPKQGVSSSFKFGRAHGTVLGVLGALRIPIHLVSPARWKKAMGLSRDKGASRRRAIELWPDHAQAFARVKDDGRAEAALIASYGLGQMAEAIPPHPRAPMPWDQPAHGGNHQ